MKIFIRVLIPLFLLICLTCTVFAADSTVTWNGMDKGFAFAPGSNYTATDLFDNFKEVMPGDIRTEVITVSNRAYDSDYIKVYLRTDTHDDPETQAFLSGLELNVSLNGTTLFEGFADVTSPVFIGKLHQRESMTLDVTLKVPLTIGNDYAGKIGKVDWIFLVESFNVPSPPPVEKQKLTVRKVWDDDGIDRPEQVTVALLRDGTAVETVELNAENQWIYTWSELDDKAVWTVEETDVPEGYTASYNTEGSTVTIINKKDQIIPPVTHDVTVRKVWGDSGTIRPTEIVVDLLKNGVVDRSVILSDENSWEYTWTNLEDGVIWTVEESSVPEGYIVSYHTNDYVTVITNTEIPTPPPVNYKTLIVEKVWDDDGTIRPKSVNIALMRDGEFVETVTLSDENNWKHTFSMLEENAEWGIEEISVPAGYEVSYVINGNQIKIINKQIPVIIPEDPINLTVEKIWEDDGSIRPQSIDIALLRNGERVDTATLSKDNAWKHIFKELEKDVEWHVEEISVPAGYEVSYVIDGNQITIINKQIPIIIQEEPINLIVEKIWEDDGSIRPMNVEISLMKNGETVETVLLSEDNNWCYKWSELSSNAVWTVSENNVPEGYVVTYRTDNDTVKVINTQIPVEHVSLKVIKVWDDAHYPDAKRPDSVSMTLYNGEIAVESVLLGEFNNWTYTWNDLDPKGQWSVIEDAIDGYTPYYSVSEQTVTVTNTAILLQTGQLKWPIPVIAGCGMLLIGIGVLLLSSNKEKKHGT